MIPWLLFALPAFAAQEPPPLCAGMGCTPRMESIAAGFEAAQPLSPGESLLASGECFHLTDSLDPATTHYGVTLLDPHEGSTFMGGLFGFFYPANPYATWTAADVRKEPPNLYHEEHRVEFTPGFAYVDMNPGGENLWRYWLKRDQMHLFVIGQWSTEQRVFCEMSFQ